MGLVQRGQVHFEQNGQSYLLVGTLFTAAYTIHSKWGTVAVLCFTVTAMGSYPYLRKQVNFLLDRNLDAKVPALLSVVISVVAIFSPALGVCLGSLMGGSLLLRDWTVSHLLKEGEEKIKTLTDQNKELGKIAEKMKEKVDALQVKFDKTIASVEKLKKSVTQHLETQGIVAETNTAGENQLDGLEAQLQELISAHNLMEISKKVSAANIGPQLDQIANTCQQQLQEIKSDRAALRNLIKLLTPEGDQNNVRNP